jgi:hypothetical protein
MNKHSALRAVIVSAVTLASSFAQAGFSVLSIQPGDAELSVHREGFGTLSQEKLIFNESASSSFTVGPGDSIGSYLIKLSNKDVPGVTSYTAVFDFGKPILGVQTRVSTLSKGRVSLKQESDFSPVRHGGALQPKDGVAIQGTQLTLTGTVRPSGSDVIRVIVQAVPEATAGLIWSIASVCGLTYWRRR